MSYSERNPERFDSDINPKDLHGTARVNNMVEKLDEAVLAILLTRINLICDQRG